MKKDAENEIIKHYNMIKMRELISKLLSASEAYYKYDNPFITDREYDRLYADLEILELDTGVIFANSPTQKVQGFLLDELKKVKHSKPMLSAKKTKAISDIITLAGKNDDFYASNKLDGLTLVLKFDNGEFIQALTRGNGIVGEDVTEQAKMITNLPLKIPYKEYLELRGECVISWANFNRINENLTIPFKHPRNLAGASLRVLDTNITKERYLEFVAFECVSPFMKNGVQLNKKLDIFLELYNLGFRIVDRVYCENNTVKQMLECMLPVNCEFPCDGVIFEFNDKEYSESLGATSHHENCRVAYKFKDESEETTITDIAWQIGRTGVLTPVAFFEPITLDGTTVSSALIHNVSYIKEMKLAIGETVAVAKMNMIIPQIVENISETGECNIPNHCPECGAETRIEKLEDTEVLYCTDPCCKGKLIRMFAWFASKEAMNINSLSSATLTKLINAKIIATYADLFTLSSKKEEVVGKIEKLGERSWERLINNIETSRHCKLENFIVALGIENIGKSTAKTISKRCLGDWNAFLELIKTHYDFSELEDIGEATNTGIYKWFNSSNKELAEKCASFLFFDVGDYTNTDNREMQCTPFTDAIIVVTGSLQNFTRESIQKEIERLGGHCSGSVSKNTDFLIAGEKAGSKLTKAQELGVKILTEEEFIKMVN